MKNHLKLCIKEITGSISPHEKSQLDSWLAESDGNKKEYENMKLVWQSSRINVKNILPDSVPELPDMESGWNELLNRISNKENRDIGKDPETNVMFQFIEEMFSRNLKPILGTALVILFIVTSLLLWDRGDTTTKLKTFATTNKQHLRVNLPDGSIAELNNASSISFLESFSDSIREVQLKGEAFFSVTKNSKPFVVITENARTKVLGTKFNVWARGEVTRVVVKEGMVNLASNSGNSNGVVLSKDQISSVVINQQPTYPESINADRLLGWLTDKLVFVQTPLNEIIGEMERYYDIKISLSNDSLKNYSVTGTFQNADADSVIAMICLTLNLDYKKDNNGYLIETKN